MPSTAELRRAELRIAVTGRSRGEPRLDAFAHGAPDPSLQALQALVGPAPPADRAVLTGGEPTLRADLPALIQAFAARPQPFVLRTDAIALGQPGIAQHLQRCGLRAVRVPLASVRPDAHDWLVGLAGAARGTTRGIRACVAVGIGVEVELPLARPVTPYLLETVEAVGRLGATALRMRAIRRQGAAAERFITLAARWGRLQPALEAAVDRAARQGLTVAVEGLPVCAARRVREALVPPGALAAAAPPGWPANALLPSPPAPGCADCPAGCPGPAADYIELFGRLELESELRHDGPRSVPPRQPAEGPVPPPPRAGRAPATRMEPVRRQVVRGSLDGDPLLGTPSAAIPDEITVPFDGRSRRELKQALVRAAQQGATTLRVEGSFDRPDLAALLRETTRLSMERILIDGLLHPLAGLSDDELRRLRKVSSVRAHLLGPDEARHDALVKPGAWAATQDALSRLERASRGRIATTAIAVVRPEHVADWPGAFEQLAAPPAFAVPPDADRDALRRACAALPPGPVRQALAQALALALDPSP